MNNHQEIKLLLVDDQKLSHVMFKHLIRPYKDIELVYYSDPEEALRDIKEINPTLILLDFVMLNMNGLTFLQRLERPFDGLTWPVIMHSAQDDPKLKSLALFHGAVDFIVKQPEQNAHELVARIRRHASNHLNMLRRIESHKALDKLRNDLQETVVKQSLNLRRINSKLHEETEPDQPHGEEPSLSSKVCDATSQAICILNVEGHAIKFNNAFETITGWNDWDLKKQTFPLYFNVKQRRSVTQELLEKALQSGSWHGELYGKHKNGLLFPLRMTLSRIHETKPKGLLVMTFTDITELDRSRKERKNLAYYDQLTHLPNRSLFLDRLEHAITQCKRNGDSCTLLSMDLDHFKHINTNFGHNAGDQVLAEIGRRLSNSVRKGDTVARIGGDAFMLLLPGLTREKDIQILTEQIQTCCRKPIMLSSEEIIISLSIGISQYPKDGWESPELVKHADMALHKAKAEGRGHALRYNQSKKQNVPSLHSMEAKMRHALKNNEFSVYYQPKLWPENGEVAGMEALVRWPMGR